MGNAALKSDVHDSFADYAKWTEDKRYELLPDVIVDFAGLFPVQEDA